ncbi:MAG: hypothetical protein H7832_06415 [Magnetococcus sp. DMHC-6]
MLSRRKGLVTWDKPSSPCLSSRISYGDPIEMIALNMVEKAEMVLKGLGFGELRVRKQGSTARIEVPETQIVLLLDFQTRQRIVTDFLALGFKCVTLDLEGFRSGKLNRVLDVSEK